jgi:hypothetical protein
MYIYRTWLRELVPLSDIDNTFYTVISNLTARTRAIESAMEYTRQFMVREKIDRQLSVKCTAIVFFQCFTILLSTLVSLCTEKRTTVTDSCQSSAPQLYYYSGTHFSESVKRVDEIPRKCYDQLNTNRKRYIFILLYWLFFLQEWMKFRENVMINTNQMESIIRKLPKSLKEHVSLGFFFKKK